MAPPPLPVKPPAPWELLRRVRLTAQKRLEENYEISDWEEDANGDRIEPDRKGKRDPKWCEGFVELTRAQAEINPDTIFGGGVPQCDLEVIFPDALYACRAKPAKRRRGSSCQWSLDRLTRREVARYTSKMGQRRQWSTLPQHVAANSGTAVAMGGQL